MGKISAACTNMMPTRKSTREVRSHYACRGLEIESGRQEAIQESGGLWEEDTWLVWEAERATAVASSTSHMNTDNEHVSHKSGRAREERERKYKIYK